MSRHRRAEETHGHGHGQDGAADDAVEVGTLARTAVLVSLAAFVVAAVVGAVWLWPDREPDFGEGGPPAFATEDTEFVTADVTEVAEPCADGERAAVEDGAVRGGAGGRTGAALTCGQVAATVTEGAGEGDRAVFPVAPEVSRSGLTEDDSVLVVRVPAEGAASYQFSQVQRGGALAWLLGIFVVAVVVVARLRGLMGLVGLGLGAVVVWQFTLPALLVGENGLAVAMTSATAIMVVVLYTTHGFSMRSSVALLGTLVGVALTGVLGLLAMGGTRLSGISDETGGLLAGQVSGLDFRGLLICGIVLTGLGVLNDVTITQASVVWELRAAQPGMPRRQVFASAMRIGRDHIASSIYTLLFAYTGAALIVLMLVSLLDRPFLELISSGVLTEEIVRTLTSAIGLVLAVPLTTGLAALLAAPAPAAARRTAPL